MHKSSLFLNTVWILRRLKKKFTFNFIFRMKKPEQYCCEIYSSLTSTTTNIAEKNYYSFLSSFAGLSEDCIIHLLFVMASYLSLWSTYAYAFWKCSGSMNTTCRFKHVKIEYYISALHTQNQSHMCLLLKYISYFKSIYNNTAPASSAIIPTCIFIVKQWC